MAPSETQILSQTLLPPSHLPSILPLQKFTLLFPSSLRSSPQIPILYRSLQLQRSLDLDAIKQNIASEALRGREQVRALARQRAADARRNGLGPGEAGVDGIADGETGGVVIGRKGWYSGKALCEGLEDAEADLQVEVQRLEDEVREMTEEAERIVDEMGGLEMDLVKGLDVGGLMKSLERVTRR